MRTATDDTPTVELLDATTTRTVCRKCKTPITIKFGDLSREEAVKAINDLNHQVRECPGFHVELSGWKYLWHLDEALEAVYGPA